MTYNFLLDDSIMENHEWQMRAKKAGLTQRTLSKLLGHAEITISRQLRGHWESGVPQHIIAAVLAWEIMSEDQRAEWLRKASDLP